MERDNYFPYSYKDQTIEYNTTGIVWRRLPDEEAEPWEDAVRNKEQEKQEEKSREKKVVMKSRKRDLVSSKLIRTRARSPSPKVFCPKSATKSTFEEGMRKRWVQAQKKKMRMSKKAVVDENENANANKDANKEVGVECPPYSLTLLSTYTFSLLCITRAISPNSSFSFVPLCPNGSHIFFYCVSEVIF